VSGTVLEAGDVVSAPVRVMSRELMRWYCDALETSTDGDGEFKIAGPTIHNDDAFAVRQGLPGIVADGMISTNWISGLLVRSFGLDYLNVGELLTKFIRPIYEDELIETAFRVAAVTGTPEGRAYSLEVWCKTTDGALCTVGTARVTVTGLAGEGR
jgi:3-hydroxybutyryl-CoA dehydratase